MKKNGIDYMKFSIEGIENNIATHVEKLYSEEKEVIGNPLFNQLAQDMELDLKRDYQYIKFPLFITKEPDDEINVCSICFGALALLNGDDKPSERIVKDYLNAAVNSLILLHLSGLNAESGDEFIFWPRNYHLGATQGEAGTLNQTSLSLSVLARLGFLQKKSEVIGSYISDTAFKNRISFVVKALRWILNNQKIDALGAAWSYAVKSTSINNVPINSAVLPTYYCIKTLDKYLNMFKRDDEIKEALKVLSPNLLSEMEEAITQSMRYLVRSQNQEGGIGKNNIESNSSYMHSMLALQILVSYGTNEYEAINKYLKYIVKVSPKDLWKSIEDNIFEKCRYQVMRLIQKGEEDEKKWISFHDTENFEIFPEGMIIISSIDIIKYLRLNNLKSKKYIKYFRKLIYLTYRKLIARMDIQGNSIYIKGRRTEEELKYPIYCLYYGKKSISKLLKYDGYELKKLLNNKITFDKFILIIALLALVAIIISTVIDCKETIIWGLTTMVTSLVAFIWKKVRGEKVCE